MRVSVIEAKRNNEPKVVSLKERITNEGREKSDISNDEPSGVSSTLDKHIDRKGLGACAFQKKCDINRSVKNSTESTNC